MRDDTNLEFDTVLTRRLHPDDLERVVALDAKVVGRRRDEYFETKLKMAIAETGVEVSLAAEIDDAFVGFLLARVFYGEFGNLEPVAVLDTIGVHPDFRKLGVGHALLDQLGKNLRGLGIPSLQTEVNWEDQTLLSFFHHEGFNPAARLCLDLKIAGR